jgi:hypothetical protein
MRTLKAILILIVSLYALSFAEASPFKSHYPKKHVTLVHDHSSNRLPVPPDMYRA